MHLFLAWKLSFFGDRCRPARIRAALGLVLIYLIAGTIPSFCLKQIASYETTQHRIRRTGARRSPKYDRSGGLQVHSKQGDEYVEQAINDALKILKRCDLCRRMFDSENSNYAIKLLERLKRDKVIIISAAIPADFSLSPNHKKLTVKTSRKFDGAAAQVIDLARTQSGEMVRPCVYINSEGFIVTGRAAEGFSLYGLERADQRAVA